MKQLRSIALLALLIISHNVLANADKTSLEKEVDQVDFDQLGEILKKDKLDQYALEKKALAKKLEQQRKVLELKRYFYPTEENFWNVISELWCVKNSLYLKWDFEKSDLGIGLSLKKILEGLSLNKKRIKILLVDSMTVAHIALPTDDNTYFLLLSLPFIRSMDLSKREISLLLLEDMMRADMGYFKNALTPKTYQQYLGQSMKNKKVEMKFVNELLDSYNEIALQKGFSFQQQYEITKKMDAILKTRSELWQAYLALIQKRDLLVRTNEGYAWYSRFYPSPEMQLTWLQPVAIKNNFGDMKKP